jgi:hypothetical protein
MHVHTDRRMRAARASATHQSTCAVSLRQQAKQDACRCPHSRYNAPTHVNVDVPLHMQEVKGSRQRVALLRHGHRCLVACGACMQATRLELSQRLRRQTSACLATRRQTSACLATRRQTSACLATRRQTSACLATRRQNIRMLSHAPHNMRICLSIFLLLRGV